MIRTLDAKRPVPAPPPGGDEDGDGVEREDELPTVVVLRQGDVGEEEFLEDRQKKIKEGNRHFYIKTSERVTAN